MQALYISELFAGKCVRSSEEIFGFYARLLKGASSEAEMRTIWEKEKSVATLMTSGSTGKPKAVEALLTQLIPSSSALRKCVWMTCYDFDKMAGIQLVLRALCNGGEDLLFFAKSLQSCDAQIIDRTTNLAATPSFVRLNSAAVKKMPKLKHITLGGELLTESSFLHIRSLGDFKITNVYANSELGVIAKSEDHRFSITADVQVVDGECVAVRRGEVITTGDLVEVHEGPFFSIIGRKQNATNIGGALVSSEALESKFEGYPYVSFAKVDFIENSVLGSVIKLTLYPNHEACSIRDFKRWQKDNIPKGEWAMMVEMATEEVKLRANGKK